VPIALLPTLAVRVATACACLEHEEALTVWRAAVQDAVEVLR